MLVQDLRYISGGTSNIYVYLPHGCASTVTGAENVLQELHLQVFIMKYWKYLGIMKINTITTRRLSTWTAIK